MIPQFTTPPAASPAALSRGDGGAPVTQQLSAATPINLI